MPQTTFNITVQNTLPVASDYTAEYNIHGYNVYVLEHYYGYEWHDDPEIGDVYFIVRSFEFIVTYTDIDTGQEKTKKAYFNCGISTMPVILEEGTSDFYLVYGGYVGGAGFFLDFAEKNGYLYACCARLANAFFPNIDITLDQYIEDNERYVRLGGEPVYRIRYIDIPLIKLAYPTFKLASLPNKTVYKSGETIDYTGLKAVLEYYNGHMIDVTDRLYRIRPEEGSSMPNSDTTVRVYFGANFAEVIKYNYGAGYVNANQWIYSEGTSYRSDIYAVNAGTNYDICLSDVVGDCFSVLFTATNPVQAESNIEGVSIIDERNPSANRRVSYTPTQNGFLAITTSTSGVENLKTQVFSAVHDDQYIEKFTLKLER